MAKKRKTRKFKICWILFENQVTPFMVDQLKYIKQKQRNIQTEFKVLLQDKKAAQIAAPLSPSPFRLGFRELTDALSNVARKRDALGNISYTDGLPAWRVLLLDDLGGGAAREPVTDLPLDNVKCIFVQIPSPIGSSDSIEMTFYALSLSAKKKGIPIIGFEFFPLNLPWTLAPSLVDGIITIRESSYDYLATCSKECTPSIWLLPPYEAPFFFLDCSLFWRKGLGHPYKFMDLFNIPAERTVIYIPHNVAMIHEYSKLLQHLSQINHNIHLMFAIGEDQARGTYTHKEIIERVYMNELQSFGSYSFHDINAVPEMIMADAVVAVCPSGSTCFSSTYGIPTIIINEEIMSGRYGNENIVRTYEDMKDEITKIIATHNKTTPLSKIITNICSEKYLRPENQKEFQGV